MAGKFYAVYKGRSGKPTIYKTWAECQKDVTGFKGAIYKSFKTEDEAKEFFILNDTSKGIKSNTKKEESFLASDGLTVYVDGSFSEEKGNYSYGLVAIYDNNIVFTDNGAGDNLEAIPLRNVSGEVLGSMKAVDFAIEKKYKNICIVFDYQGVESWAIGTWKRNNKITQEYNRFMQDKMKEIKIRFKKVKGHSGDKFNDMADKLAKEALGI